MGGKETETGTPSAVEQWLESLQGRAVDLAYHGRERQVECDYCSEIIRPSRNKPQATHLAVSETLNGPPAEAFDAPFALTTVYCGECDRRQLVFPCQGYHEILLSGRITPEYTIEDWEIIDFSGASDGVAWDPIAAWEAFFDFEFEEYHTAMQVQLAPEDVVNNFLSMGIDIREIVDPETGEVILSEERREELTEQMMEDLPDVMGEDLDEWNPL